MGSRAKTPSIVVVCARSCVPEHPMVGYTASKKVGNSVARNKAKRRLRSLVRLFASGFAPEFSFVFIATADTAICNYSKLESDFLYCLKRAKERASA